MAPNHFIFIHFYPFFLQFYIKHKRFFDKIILCQPLFLLRLLKHWISNIFQDLLLSSWRKSLEVTTEMHVFDDPKETSEIWRWDSSVNKWFKHGWWWVGWWLLQGDNNASPVAGTRRSELVLRSQIRFSGILSPWWLSHKKLDIDAKVKDHNKPPLNKNWTKPNSWQHDAR